MDDGWAVRFPRLDQPGGTKDHIILEGPVPDSPAPVRHLGATENNLRARNLCHEGI